MTKQTSGTRLRAVIIALALAMVLVPAVTAQGQTFTTLYNFTGSSDGGYPFGGLAWDANGNLYGTTYYGGSYGYGTVFEVVPSGPTESVLWSFSGSTDGAWPYAGVAVGGGNVYGTAYYYGADYCGTVWEVPTTGGSETTLHSFTCGSDGGYPFAGVTMGPKGALFGSAADEGSDYDGTLWSIAPNGTFNAVSFDYTDGGYPYQNPICGTRTCEILYGATESGGSYGYGAVYKWNRKTGAITVLHNFDYNGTDGAYPIYGYLIEDNKGNLYGTTEEGGANGYGTVYKINEATGTETILHSFNYTSSDGAYPLGGVARDIKGNLYGTTEASGTGGYGVLYKLTPKGTETILVNFDYTNGAYPYANPIVLRNGTLYGTTYYGGSGGYGTVWEYVP